MTAAGRAHARTASYHPNASVPEPSMLSIVTVTTRTPGVAGFVVLAFLLAASAGNDERTATIGTSTATGDVVAAIPVKLAAVADEAAAQPVTGTGVVALRDEIALSFKVGGILARVLAREGQVVRTG